MYIDKKYINQISPLLERFKWKSDNLANCRCKICGDSQKNKSKSRGYFFLKGKFLYIAVSTLKRGQTELNRQGQRPTTF